MAVTWTRQTFDGVISRIPTLLYGIVITPDSGTNNADVTLYNGESTSDEKICQLRSGAGISSQHIFEQPIICSRGLYVDIGTNVTEVMICWDIKT